MSYSPDVSRLRELEYFLLPLPARRKKSPPKGWLDHTGPYEIPPGSNVAIGTRGEVAILITNDEAATAWATERYGPPNVRSRRGGHWYFRPNGLEGNESNVETQVGTMELYVRRKYALIPPSLHPSGFRYAWERPLPPLAELPTCPDLRAIFRGARRPQAGPSPSLQAPAGEGAKANGKLPSHTHHDFLWRRAADLARAGLRAGDIGRQLLEDARSFLPDIEEHAKDIPRLAAWAERRSEGRPRALERPVLLDGWRRVGTGDADEKCGTWAGLVVHELPDDPDHVCAKPVRLNDRSPRCRKCALAGYAFREAQEVARRIGKAIEKHGTTPGEWILRLDDREWRPLAAAKKSRARAHAELGKAFGKTYGAVVVFHRGPCDAYDAGSSAKSAHAHLLGWLPQRTDGPGLHLTWVGSIHDVAFRARMLLADAYVYGETSRSPRENFRLVSWVGDLSYRAFRAGPRPKGPPTCPVCGLSRDEARPRRGEWVGQGPPRSPGASSAERTCASSSRRAGCGLRTRSRTARTGAAA